MSYIAIAFTSFLQLDCDTRCAWVFLGLSFTSQATCLAPKAGFEPAARRLTRGKARTWKDKSRYPSQKERQPYLGLHAVSSSGPVYLPR